MKEFILNPYTTGIINNNSDNTLLTVSGWNTEWRKLKVGEVIMIATSTKPMYGHTYEVIANNSPLHPSDQFFIDLKWRKK